MIIDTDPGVDDAMAILYAAAAPDIDLLGLTTVFGNVTTPIATRNALRLVEMAGLDIPVAESDVSLHRALTADEAFLTSTSLCVCPVRSIDGAPFEGSIPGPITRQIMDGFAERAGFDYVGQYLSFLGGGASAGI